MPVSFGMCANNSSSASSPPAEAPMPTIGNRRSRPLAAGVAGAVADGVGCFCADRLPARGAPANARCARLAGFLVAIGESFAAGFGPGGLSLCGSNSGGGWQVACDDRAMLRTIELTLSVKSLQTRACVWPPWPPRRPLAIAILLANIGSPREIGDPMKTLGEKHQC